VFPGWQFSEQAPPSVGQDQRTRSQDYSAYGSEDGPSLASRMADLHIGTSAFTAAGWEGSFYPRGIQPRTAVLAIMEPTELD